MFVAVEGIDCAGKGEVCPRLATAIKAIVYKTPPDHMREKQNQVNATATDREHYDFFRSVVQEASSEIELIYKDRNVVVDRYFASTIAYHRVMGIDCSLEDMGRILMPDYTVYLTVSPEVQSVRMQGRGMSPGDVRMDGRQHLIRNAYRELFLTLDNVIPVDTDNRNPDEVVEYIVSKIQRAHN